MIVDPIEAIALIYNVAQAIYKQVELVKANKAQCQRLAERINVITQAIQSLEKISNKNQYIDGLNALHQHLNKCLSFIQKFSHKKPWFKEVAKAGTHKERFEALTKSLAEALAQLNLGLVAKQVLDHEQDKQDQTQDMQTLKANQEMILQLNQAALEELQQLKFTQDEQHAVLLKQVASLRMHMEHNFAIKPTKTKPLINPNDEIVFYDLRFEKCIGQGTFGKVYQGFWWEQEVAIKMIEGELSPKQLDEFVREIKIQRHLKSPQVTQFFAACLEPNRACLVMEYMEQGSLRDLLDKTSLKLEQQKQLALDIIRGLHYLHQRKVFHRDLKSSNVLINQAGRAKLSDFGLAKIQSLNIKTAVQQSQALAWLAPELFKRDHYTEASDVYSYGVILWEIVTGQKPFSHPFNANDNNNAGVYTEQAIITCILQGQRDPIPVTVPEKFRELIEACWSLDPQQRPDTLSIIHSLEALQLLPPPPTPEQEYEQGIKEEQAKRYEKAYQHYDRAYKQGFFKAGTNLGSFFLENNKGVTQNKQKAYEYFLEAAQKGHGRAMYNLARMLEKGDGIEKDILRALSWYEGAAKQNIPQAQQKYDALIQLLNLSGYLKDNNQTPKLQRNG